MTQNCIEKGKFVSHISEATCKEALEEMLSPPIPSTFVEQSIRTGFLESPKSIPKHVIVIAEFIPSWLAAADSWGASQLSLYCEKELNWYRSNLDVMTPLQYFPTVAGLAKGDWLSEKNRVILVQGSTQFCSKMITGLGSLGITTNDKIIVTCNGTLRKLKLSFKFLRLAHSNFGGCTETITSVGFSKGCGIADHVEMSTGISSSVMDHICPAENGTSSDPSSTDARSSKGLSSMSTIISSEFIVPSIFSKTNWVRRKLTSAEILSILDSPVQISKAVNNNTIDTKFERHHDIAKTLIPLKSIQEASRILFGFKTPKEERHTIPLYDVNRLGPELSAGLVDIYTEIDQAKVAKNDDSKAETDLWDTQASICSTSNLPDDIELLLVNTDHRNFRNEKETLFSFLRTCSHLRYKKNVRQSFSRHMHTSHGLEVFTDEDIQDLDEVLEKVSKQTTNKEAKLDLIEGIQAISKADSSSFWEWDNGSFPYFWRWQSEIKKDLRDGTPLWFHENLLPRNTSKRQRLPTEKGMFEKMVTKIIKVRDRGYIGKLLLGPIKSLTHYFAVPKGDEDIRMVYDMTASGLNNALWAPSFWMPTAMNVIDCSTSGTWFGDVDAGEMFLNFPLDRRIRKYCGIDLSWMAEDGGVLWECWNRMAMGMCPSPWVTIRLLMWMMEIVIGNPKDPSNPFRWDRVILNLPGDSNYNPGMPRVYKWNAMANAIACDCKFFCDDFRVIGPNEDLTQKATHKLETTMAYLGIQDATRKRRKVTKRPGEWTGSILLTVDEVGLFATVSQLKWDRAKTIIKKWNERIQRSKYKAKYKELESDVGFLVHLAMTYSNIKPFLKGLYSTLNGWRKDRDDQGWKMSQKAYDLFLQLGRKAGDTYEQVDFSTKTKEDPTPEFVNVVPLMVDHIRVLDAMFQSEQPTLLLKRGFSRFEAMYIFGDASGLGFGSSSWTKGDGVQYRYGIWGMDVNEATSNYRELRNLVESLERSGLAGELNGKEIFLFTDNSTAEAVVHKGSSTSPLLYDLVTRLYKLTSMFLCSLNIVHVAGTRMISQGTDGLSRGDMLEGVLKGRDMLSFVPLHLSPIQRDESLKKWISSWAIQKGYKAPEFLKPRDWFDKGHDIIGYRKNIDGRTIPSYSKGTYIWSLPPSAARFAIEELRQARHKRQASLHVILVPKLMSPEWLGLLHKTADIIFTLPVGHPNWDLNKHEPLTIAICFPYLHRAPWELKGTPLMGRMARELCRVFKTDPGTGRYFLSELLQITHRLDRLSLQQLRKVLSGRWAPKLSNQQTIE